MNVWVFITLAMICVTLLAICVCLMWEVHDQREDIDLVTKKLIEVLEERDAPKLISVLNGFNAKR